MPFGVVLTGASALLAAGLVVALNSGSPNSPAVVRFTLPLSEQDSVYLGGAPAFGRPFLTEVAFSPD